MNNDIFSQPTDQQALTLTHAIALQESGQNGKPNYNAKGDAGTSKGAYQWQLGNYEAAAKKYGLDPNDFSPANQDKVAYAQVKEYKDKGFQPAEIASLWNSGSPHNYENHSGTTTINGQEIHYDTPKYVQGVKSHYQQLMGEYDPSPYSGGASPVDYSGTESTTNQPAQDQSLGGELLSRTEEAGGAIQDTLHGKINPISGILQTGGAIGGAVGDVVNKGLDLIPGVKWLEDKLGQGIGALAKTPVGQSVIQSMQNFATAHPELSKDIGAGFNIATAIPILRGLGVVKNIAMDATAQALKGVAEKSFTKDLTEISSRTIGGRKALQTTPDVVKTIVDERAIPDVVEGRLKTQEAYTKLGQSISDIENNELSPELAKANVPATENRIPLAQYKKEALGMAQDRLKDTGPVEKYFERLRVKYGDYPTLQQMNEAKRIVADNISEAGFMSPTYTTDKIVRSVLQKSVEDGAKALGLKDVSLINQKMARLIKAQKLMKILENKAIKEGAFRSTLTNAATVGGEVLGESTGVPFAGALVGRNLGGKLGKKLTGGIEGILKRTGKDAVKTSVKESKGKLAGMIGGALSQKGLSR